MVSTASHSSTVSYYGQATTPAGRFIWLVSGLCILLLLALVYVSASSSSGGNLRKGLRAATAPVPHNETVSTDTLLSALAKLDAQYTLTADRVVYGRYARVYDREIRFPDGRTFLFDIWGRVWKNDSFSVVAVVPFDSATQTFTLVREYNPAHARHVYGFPQGMVELGGKHRSLLDAAQAELEEEAHLSCEQSHFVNLFSTPPSSQSAVPDAHSPKPLGVPQDKYQRESVFFFLCPYATHVNDPAHLDDEEEHLEIVHGVTTQQVYDLARAGALQSNNVAAGLMAIEELRNMQLVPR